MKRPLPKAVILESTARLNSGANLQMQSIHPHPNPLPEGEGVM